MPIWAKIPRLWSKKVKCGFTLTLCRANSGHNTQALDKKDQVWLHLYFPDKKNTFGAKYCATCLSSAIVTCPIPYFCCRWLLAAVMCFAATSNMAASLEFSVAEIDAATERARESLLVKRNADIQMSRSKRDAEGALLLLSFVFTHNVFYEPYFMRKPSQRAVIKTFMKDSDTT